MRKIYFLLIFVLIALSCSSDDDGNIFTASMSASIDGTSWSTITRVTVLENNKFIITGTALDGKSIVITIFGSTSGTYNLNLSAINFEALYKETISTSTDDAYIAVSGVVVLTEVNTTEHKISGTFNFNMKKSLTTETVSVTDGTFDNLLYTEP